MAEEVKRCDSFGFHMFVLLLFLAWKPGICPGVCVRETYVTSNDTIKLFLGSQTCLNFQFCEVD